MNVTQKPEMESVPGLTKLPIGDGAMNNSEDSGEVLQRLEAELSERARVEEELNRLNGELELRLKESTEELAAVSDELRREMFKRAEDQKEICILNENLTQQKSAFLIVNRELESFCYSISHDLRAPIRHLVGFSGVLLEDYGDTLDKTAQSYLDCIVRAGRKMESLIESLLTLSRIARQEMKPASVDLSKMARECADSLKDSAPERCVVFTIPEKLSVQADADMLRAVIGNLLGNAWKYTGKKEMAKIELGQKLDGESRVFYLRDNGAGFDMQYADKLFGPFQRMHKESEFEGAGIGLATVQRIIHRHGGRIWADALVDGGATFFFTLSE
jgi:light-regulated signal transduction histidine kinase (bacteriophytochrome)